MITFDPFSSVIDRFSCPAVVIGTVQHPAPFDFHTSDSGRRLAAGAEVIPFHAMQAALEEFVLEGAETESSALKGDGRRLVELRRATSARVLHIIPPPPPEDSEYIARRHERQFERQGLVRSGVSPPALRLKIWRLQTGILQRFCDREGIEVLMPPVDGLTAGGYLRPEYRKGAIHANSDYGELVLRCIEARCC